MYYTLQINNYMNKIIVLSCLVMILVTDAKGQIINVEANRLPADSMGWNGLVTTNFYTNKNTSVQYSLDAGSKIQFRKGSSLWLSLNHARFLFKNTDQLENQGYQHFRYNYLWTDLITWEAFTQIQFDQVLRIDVRALVGTGPKFNLVREKHTRISVGTLYMFEHEREQGNDIIHNDHRISAYLSLSWRIFKQLYVQNITYYQPRIDYFSDYRVSSGTNLTLDLNSRFSFNTGVSLNYDSSPVIDPGIEKFTYTISNGLIFKF